MATTVKPSDKVRIGIIGCGGIATGKHLPALHKLSNIEMVAFCDLIRSRAESAAKNYGTPDAKVYENYKELLEDKTIDVVHVLTPNRSHSFISVDAMEAGKHVMCEKPMAINAEEAKKMVDAAKRTGKKLTIGTRTASATTRFSPRRRSRPARSAKSTTRERPRCAAERCRLGACSSTSTSRAAVR